MEQYYSTRYNTIRQDSIKICSPLNIEDFVVQPAAYVSPPKWHLGHTSWFFETMLLKPYLKGYIEFNDQYNYVFNSYYETLGVRVIRTERGNLSRPSVEDVYKYRAHVDRYMNQLIAGPQLSPEILEIIELGLQHEQQHQELLITDIKYIMGHNPLFPAYDEKATIGKPTGTGSVHIPKGLYEIGATGEGFSFDNEHGRHTVWLDDFAIAASPVSNSDYLAFINDGGYKRFEYWHSAGWDWVKNNQIQAPLYWHYLDGEWKNYTLRGILPVAPSEAVCHISYYEAAAYALWKGKRLPTEAEWEIAADQFNWGLRWEWTNSAYLAYPGFTRVSGARGEYNGKFMVNQMVLRGASEATPDGHGRKTYRNFFHSHERWQYTGIRLAE